MTNPFNGHLKPLFTRLAEAMIIGGVIMYGTVKMLETKLESVEQNLGFRISAVEKSVERINSDFYKPRVYNQTFQHPALNHNLN